MAIALNEGVTGPDDTYHNPARQLIDGRSIDNFTPGYVGKQGIFPISYILTHSLNTGVVEMLKRLGKTGSTTSIDAADCQVFYDYAVGQFHLGSKTGIDLPGEVNGVIPHHSQRPYLRDHFCATVTFGQSITVTLLQMAATYAAIFNGGTYYQPHIASQIGERRIEPQVLSEDILQPQTLTDLRQLMRDMSQTWKLRDVQYPGFEISAKTGTAQILDPATGRFLEDLSNGFMIGYIKGQRQTLVVAVFIERPKVTYAGSQGAGPIWKAVVANIIALGRVY